jgi:hypothetical protein
MAQYKIIEVRNFAGYSYLTLLMLGTLMAFYGLSLILWSLSWSWAWYWGWGMGTLIGVVILALGGFGAFTAFTVWKPKLVDAIDQGRYADAYQVASNPIQLIIGLICGSVIPAILLFLTQQKLAEIVRPAPPPPPPPPPPPIQKDMRKEVKKYEEYLEKLEVLRREGKISEEAYEKLKREYEKEIEELRNEGSATTVMQRVV